MEGASVAKRIRARSMGRRRWAIALAAVVASALLGPVVAANAATSDLVVSRRADHVGASPLARAELKGDVYVTLSGHLGAKKVAFYLDDIQRTGAPFSVDVARPFDLAGTTTDGKALPLRTSTLADGRHSLVAVVTRKDGSTRKISTMFKVKNGKPPSSTTTTSTSSAPSTTVAPTTTSTTVAPTTTTTAAPPSSTTTTTAAPSPPSSGFPDATNTGYLHAPGYPGSLTDCSNLTIQSNTTYHFCHFPAGLWIGDSLGNGPQNVTFVGCLFEADFSGAGGGTNAIVQYANGNNITFSYSTFKPAGVTSAPVSYSAGVQFAVDQVEYISGDHATVYAAGGFTVDHSNLWGLGNSIQLGASSQTQPVTISNNWFHDMRADGGGIDHTDGILVNGGAGVTYLTIDHNTIVGVGNTNGIALQGEGGYHNITVTRNYVSGFGYTVTLGNNGTGNTNNTFTDNVFGTDLQPGWGPLYVAYGGDSNWHSDQGNVWRRNTIHVAPGGFVSDTSAEGKYWLPQWTDQGYPTPSATDWNL